MARQTINCQQAKHIDMVEYLQSLNIHAASIKGNNYWYYSPLHNERTPSFKIDRKLNVWYDHSIGKGGNLIDFGMIYFNCSLSEFLNRLNHFATSFSFHQPDILPKEKCKGENKIMLIEVRKITDQRLCNYLQKRAISNEIANTYCKEILFEINRKEYTAIGFKNNAGGYELRNTYYKGSVSPKSFTFIDNGKTLVTVFEGFFDFLSYVTIEQENPFAETNFLILNSLSFFEKAKGKMELHDQINLQLDRDNAGLSCAKSALQSSPKYHDQSKIYDGFKDLNEWLVNFPKQANQHEKDPPK